jgi:hypothetical protein
MFAYNGVQCVRCHRELIPGGRVQFGVLWGDAPPRVQWDRKLMPWPSIAVCGICALEFADWLATAPPPGQDDGEAAAEPTRGAARPARAKAPRGRARAEARRIETEHGPARVI